MAKQKTPSDVRGVKAKCVNYAGCPMCYGCRNYSSNDPDCSKCVEDGSKKNICNTNLHRGDLINKLITKNVMTFKEEVQFKSNR